MTEDEERACEAMDVFEELFESEVAIVVPHIKPVINLNMKIASGENLEEAIRVKAITILGRMTKMKKKAIVKHKLYIPMINVLFPIVCQLDDEDEEEEEMNESNKPSTCACQVLDVLAINLPPEKFMHALLSHVQPAIESNDPAKMKGAFNALAVCAEGCSEHIRNKYLVNLLQVIGNGIKHDVPAVRNSALYALGQYSEYLQPEISEYAGEILPVLFQYMDSSLSKAPQQKDIGLDRIFYALEVFSENLEDKLVPFLPELMQRLLHILESGANIRTRQLSISAIGAAANASEEAIIPYFGQIMPHLKTYLSDDQEGGDEGQVLLTQSMETLSILARCVGPTQFGPTMAEECCQLGLDLVAKHDDPDVRKCAYALFSAVAFVVKDEISIVLQKIVDLMLRSCQSKEGISLEFKDDELDLPDLSEEEDDDKIDDISLNTEDTEEEVEKVKAVNVLNSYMEEKEQALLALKEIAKHATNSFMPYLFQSLQEAWNLVEFPDCEVRKAAVEALVEFCICYYKQNDASSLEAFDKAVQTLVPKLCSMIKEDEDVGVVCDCLDELARLLKECKDRVTQVGGHPEMIVQSVRQVMSSDCKCMDDEKFEGEDEDEEEAEQDELLFQSAGEVIPSLGLGMTPVTFSPYFAGMLPHLLKKSKKHCTVSERSFSAGVLAECVRPLTGVLEHYIQVLLNTFLQMSSDEDEDVRNNAIFGLGELALHGGDIVHQHYPTIMQNLSNVLSTEESGRVIDQIVAALCRLIIAQKDLVPLKEVFPVVMNHLPLKVDKEEYEIVFKCLMFLVESGEELLKESMPNILNVIGTVIGDKKCKLSEDSKARINAIVQCFYKDLNQEFLAAVGQLSPEVKSNIEKIVSS